MHVLLPRALLAHLLIIDTWQVVPKIAAALGSQQTLTSREPQLTALFSAMTLGSFDGQWELATHAAEKLRTRFELFGGSAGAEGHMGHKLAEWTDFQTAFGDHCHMFLRAWLDDAEKKKNVSSDGVDHSFMFRQWCEWFLQASDFSLKAEKFKKHAKCLLGRSEGSNKSMVDSEKCLDVLKVYGFDTQQQMVLMEIDATRMEMSIRPVEAPQKPALSMFAKAGKTFRAPTLLSRAFSSMGGRHHDTHKQEPDNTKRVKISNLSSLRPLGNQLVIHSLGQDNISIFFNNTPLRRRVGDCLSELQGYASAGGFHSALCLIVNF